MRLILDQIRYQRIYTSEIRLITRENKLLQILIDLEHLQIFSPSLKFIEEYENIYYIMTKARLHANSKTRKLCMTKVH